MSKPTSSGLWKKSSAVNSEECKNRKPCPPPSRSTITASFDCCTISGCINDWTLEKCVIAPNDTCRSQLSPCVLPGVNVEADFRVTVTNSIGRRVCYVSELSLSSEKIDHIKKLKVGLYRNDILVDVKRFQDLELTKCAKRITIAGCITLDTAPLTTDSFRLSVLKVIDRNCEVVNLEQTECTVAISTCSPENFAALVDNALLTGSQGTISTGIVSITDIAGVPIPAFQQYVTNPITNPVVIIPCSAAPIVVTYRVTVTPTSATACVGNFLNTAQLFDDIPSTDNLPIAVASVLVTPVCATPTLSNCSFEVTHLAPWALQKVGALAAPVTTACVRDIDTWLRINVINWPVKLFFLTTCRISAADIANFLFTTSENKDFRLYLRAYIAAALNAEQIRKCRLAVPNNIATDLNTLLGILGGALINQSEPLRCILSSAPLISSTIGDETSDRLNDFSDGRAGFPACDNNVGVNECLVQQVIAYTITVTAPDPLDTTFCVRSLFSLLGCTDIAVPINSSISASNGVDTIFLQSQEDIAPKNIDYCSRLATIGFDEGTVTFTLSYPTGTLNVSSNVFTTTGPRIIAATCSVDFDFGIEAVLCDTVETDCDYTVEIDDSVSAENKLIIETILDTAEEKCVKIFRSVTLPFNLVLESGCSGVVTNTASLIVENPRFPQKIFSPFSIVLQENPPINPVPVVTLNKPIKGLHKNIKKTVKDAEKKVNKTQATKERKKK